MHTSTGEAYTQEPVERLAPPVSIDHAEEGMPVSMHDGQQQPASSLQPQPQQQQNTTSNLSDNLDKLSIQDPPQAEPASPPVVSNTGDAEHTEDPFGEWTLKEITWPDPRIGGYRRTVKVLTQNANGPCSLLALANVLILRGSIHISSKLDKISYSALAALIADFLVTRPQDANARGLTLEAALDILPTTVSGLNVNVGFDDIKSFQATEEGSSDELALFAMAGVELVHGWIADKSSGEEWEALERASGGGVGGRKQVPTYDGVQEAIIKGLDGQGQNSSDAVVLQQFLQSSATQLTFPGLFALNALESGSVFFRNSHLSVLYRRHNPPTADAAAPAPAHTSSPAERDDTSPTLFQLVTDQSFASEPEITWESIVDIDGAGTNYYNSEFYPAGGAGGDYSGMSAGEVVRRDERARREQEREEARLRGEERGAVYEGEFRSSLEDHTDLQLARALQEEEDRAIAEQYRDQEERQHRRQRTQLDPAMRARAAPQPEGEEGGEAGDLPSSSSSAGGRDGKVKKDKKGKKDCIVM
ncbi:hypothetical protein QFC21_006860 [Naganishia friedmannii]|uniref:Uncharacterized protein n=1 Tax=Naganishia friedmannii TaxID=89922 RepID=A0ACC2UZP9_9TREE|nr:hypothetical protein QFC21_006860 [Naganishia friedmannii]